MTKNRKQHWEKVYDTKQPAELSWTQDFPKTSLDFIHSCRLPKKASIIDIGGGNSKLVDFLVKDGYSNVTVLDISEIALKKAKARLGKDAAKVNWIAADITEFAPSQMYDVWHDRATFHFLTSTPEINKYLDCARKTVRKYLTIGTFSETGPDKCSGLPTKKYKEAGLQKELSDGFEKIKCITEDHITPFNTTQNFLFCSFKRQNADHSTGS